MLVNDIWGGEVLKGGPAEWNTPIWEHDLDDGLRILRLAIDTHLITSHHLLPLLIDRPGGLLVEVTDGTTEYNAAHYRISVYYDLAKVGGQPAGVLPGPRARAARRDRGGAHAGLAALGDDARGLRRHRGELARRVDRRERPRRPTSRCRSRRGSSGRAVAALAADPGPGPVEPAVGDVGAARRRSTASPTSTARRPDVWRFIEQVRETGARGRLHRLPVIIGPGRVRRTGGAQVPAGRSRCQRRWW